MPSPTQGQKRKVDIMHPFRKLREGGPMTPDRLRDSQ